MLTVREIKEAIDMLLDEIDNYMPLDTFIDCLEYELDCGLTRAQRRFVREYINSKYRIEKRLTRRWKNRKILCIVKEV